MGKQNAIEMRNELNRMIDVFDGSSQEDHIIRSCIALAVEELELWIYDGEFTPSVKPIREGKEFKESITERFPTLQRLKNKGKIDDKKPIVGRMFAWMKNDNDDEPSQEYVKWRKQKDERKRQMSPVIRELSPTVSVRFEDEEDEEKSLKKKKVPSLNQVFGIDDDDF